MKTWACRCSRGPFPIRQSSSRHEIHPTTFERSDSQPNEVMGEAKSTKHTKKRAVARRRTPLREASGAPRSSPGNAVERTRSESERRTQNAESRKWKSDIGRSFVIRHWSSLTTCPGSFKCEPGIGNNPQTRAAFHSGAFERIQTLRNAFLSMAGRVTSPSGRRPLTLNKNPLVERYLRAYHASARGILKGLRKNDCPTHNN